jgi:hypothetical protein
VLLGRQRSFRQNLLDPGTESRTVRDILSTGWYDIAVAIDEIGRGSLHPEHNLRGHALSAVRRLTVNEARWWGAAARMGRNGMGQSKQRASVR